MPWNQRSMRKSSNKDTRSDTSSTTTWSNVSSSSNPSVFPSSTSRKLHRRFVSLSNHRAPALQYRRARQRSSAQSSSNPHSALHDHAGQYVRKVADGITALTDCVRRHYSCFVSNCCSDIAPCLKGLSSCCLTCCDNYERRHESINFMGTIYHAGSSSSSPRRKVYRYTAESNTRLKDSASNVWEQQPEEPFHSYIERVARECDNRYAQEAASRETKFASENVNDQLVDAEKVMSPWHPLRLNKATSILSWDELESRHPKLPKRFASYSSPVTHTPLLRYRTTAA